MTMGSFSRLESRPPFIRAFDVFPRGSSTRASTSSDLSERTGGPWARFSRDPGACLEGDQFLGVQDGFLGKAIDPPSPAIKAVLFFLDGSSKSEGPLLARANHCLKPGDLLESIAGILSFF